MADPNGALRQTRPRFKVGDWVTYVVGDSRHPCEVIQYIGTIGAKATHYYRLREPIWYSEPQDFDFPESSLERATPTDLASRYPPEERLAEAGVSG